MIVDIRTPSVADNDRAAREEHSPERWLQVASHLDPRYGGVSAVVPQLSASLAQAEGLTIDIANFSKNDETDVLARHPELYGSHWPANRAAWIRKRGLRTQFSKEIACADGLHIHGLWETHASVAAKLARLIKKPYVISAHGMLDPWALANKGLKKRLYSALVERANLEHAACLHALTLAEAEDYRRYGSRRPIAVIPNGVDLPTTVDRPLFLRTFPQVRGQRMVLFLGRIHRKKGIDILVDAWADIASRFPRAVLVMAGPDCENARASVEAKIERCGIGSRVVFTGMLAQEMKWSALANAHCFVLPSYSEGLSVAALEAMGLGVPVVVSDRCHLPEVAQYGAGLQIAAKLPEIVAALEEILTNSDAAISEIGGRGRQLVQERFTWNVVAHQMAELYRWVLCGATPQTFELLEMGA